MQKQKISKFIDKWPINLKQNIKNIYNQVNDVRVLSIDDILVTEKEFDNLIELMQKVNSGEDITFEIGYRYFRGNKLNLEKGVFVPQYDTEQIVDLVKDKINQGRFLEIGTGTGAISISIANETEMTGLAIDINPKAIELAKTNFEKNHKTSLDKLDFNLMDFLDENLNQKFDLIISNPPYIAFDDVDVEDWVKENQPYEALYASDNGLALYKEIFRKVPKLLNHNGYIILEIGYDQGEIVKDLAMTISNDVEVIKDYEQYDRFVVVRYNEK